MRIGEIKKVETVEPAPMPSLPIPEPAPTPSPAERPAEKEPAKPLVPAEP